MLFLHRRLPDRIFLVCGWRDWQATFANVHTGVRLLTSMVGTVGDESVAAMQAFLSATALESILLGR